LNSNRIALALAIYPELGAKNCCLGEVCRYYFAPSLPPLPEF
jgi:hypothetical protein